MATASPYIRTGIRPGRAEPRSSYAWVVVGIGLFGLALASGISLAFAELEALYITVSLTVCLAVLYDFRVGVVALVLLVGLQNTAYFPHGLMGITGLNPSNLLLAGTLVSCLLHGRLKGFLPRPLALLYVLPIVCAGLLGATHVDEIIPQFFELGIHAYDNAFGYLRDELVKPMLIVLLGLLVGSAVASSQKPDRFLIPIALSVWFIALLEIGYIIHSGVRLGSLASSDARTFLDSALGMHANSLGRLFAVAYALLLFPWWETKRPGLKLFLFLTMGALAFSLLLTFSRGAFVGFLLVNLLFLVWRFNLKTLGMALIAAAVCVALAPEAVVGRLTVGFDTGEADAISAGRVESIWLPLLPELARSPLWGNGLVSTTWSAPMEAGAMLMVGHPHNAYLEALLDMGVIGLCLLLAYYWHVWRGFRALGSNAWLSPEMRGFFQGGAAALVCFFVTGMAGSSLRPTAEFAYLWVAIGIMYGVARRKPAAASGKPAT